MQGNGRDTFLASDVMWLTGPEYRHCVGIGLRSHLDIFAPRNPTFVPAKIDHLALEANPFSIFFLDLRPGREKA